MDPKNGCRFVLLSVAVVCVPMLPAFAGGYDVTPVRIDTKGEIATVKVTNPGDQRIYIETSVFDWSLDSLGRQVLAESDAAVVSPPAMWIAPHASYLIRLRLPRPHANRELPFRVTLEQIPDRDSIVAGRVSVMIKQSLPAFSLPDSPTPPDLVGSLSGGILFIENKGGEHARIDSLSQDGKVLAKGLLGYALAGERLGIKIPVHPGRIDLKTDMGGFALDVR